MYTTEPRPLVTRPRQRGFTLIELIIFIVVVSVGIVGLLAVVNRVGRSSADPTLNKQSVAIAESMLEEILQRDYADPDGTATGETGRTNWDNVADYNNYAKTGITDMQGNAIAGLEKYKVAVKVASVGASDDAALVALTSKPLKVTVSVTSPAGDVLQLTGYRANY